MAKKNCSKKPECARRALAPPIKTHGGKHYQAKGIIGQMPPHIHYVEPFGGGLAVLLAKEHEGFSEVVNDVHGTLMNFWQVLGTPALFAEFQRRVEMMPFSERVWREQEAKLDSGTQVERAIAFFARARLSREGKGKMFATLSKNRTRRSMNEQASSLLTAVDGLSDVQSQRENPLMLTR